jgi:acetate kinase
MLNHESGLTAISNGTGDMRDLEGAAAAGDAKAKLAIEIFCIAIRKFVAAYAAVLGGLDMLVFTGGIGEHSARVRSEVCRGLEFLGVSIDDSANQSHAREVSTANSKIRAYVIASEEDRQIARHCRALLKSD